MIQDTLRKIASLLIVLGVLASPAISYAKSVRTVDPLVKKSLTSICHAKGTRYYKQTLKFIPFDTLKGCLKSGGRLPKK